MTTAADHGATLRDRLAYLTFPVLMGGFVALTAWGLQRGADPATLGVVLTLANFFVILGVEQLLPRNHGMNVFRDRQSINDAGHGLLLAVLARPAGGALSIFLMAHLTELRAVGDLPCSGPSPGRSHCSCSRGCSSGRSATTGSTAACTPSTGSGGSTPSITTRRRCTS